MSNILRALLSKKYLLVLIIGIVLFALSFTVMRGPRIIHYGSCIELSLSAPFIWEQKHGFPMTAFTKYITCGIVQPNGELSYGSSKVSAAGTFVNAISAVGVAWLFVTAANTVKKKSRHGK